MVSLVPVLQEVFRRERRVSRPPQRDLPQPHLLPSGLRHVPVALDDGGQQVSRLPGVSSGQAYTAVVEHEAAPTFTLMVDPAGVLKSGLGKHHDPGHLRRGRRLLRPRAAGAARRVRAGHPRAHADRLAVCQAGLASAIQR